MEYTIYLDGIGHGPWMGHLLSEPGCIWLGPNPTAITGAAPESIARYFAWLRTHGEPDVPVLTSDVIEVHAAEEQQIPFFGRSGAAVGFFAPDLEPVTDREIAIAVRRLGYARRNLLEAVAELPPEALDWQPPRDKRTIRQNLEHIRNAQVFFLTRVFGAEAVGEILPEPWPQDTFHSLNWVMDRSVWALTNLPQRLRSGVYHAEEPTEDWTARKMLRRFVEHEMEHLGVVRLTFNLWQLSQANSQTDGQASPEP